MPDDGRYAYAVSRVRALETRLISRPVVDRLLAEDADGLLRWARESEYASAFSDVETVGEFPVGLDRHLLEVFELLERISPEPDLVRTFRLRYDYHNLKTLYKAQALDREAEPAFTDLGTIPAERLAGFIKDEAWVWLPDRMREAWRRALAETTRGGSLLRVGAIFDNAMYAHRLAVAQEHQEPFLEEFYRQAITMHNIVTFLRVKDGAAPRDEFDAMLLDGGTLERSFFRRHYDEPVQLFLDSLGRTDYARHILTRGVEALPEDRAYWRLAIARDNYFVYFLGQSARDCFSVGPLAHYIIRKKAERRLLYTLWLAARAQWDRATVQARLRSVYA